MVERRDVELLIRARDLSTKPLRDVAAALDQISDSLASQVDAARRGEASYQELAASFRQVQQAGQALAQTQGALDRFNKLSAESARLADQVREASVSLRDFRTSIEGSETVSKRQEAQLRRLESAYARAQRAFQRNADQIDASRQSLAEAGVNTDNLASEQQRLVATAQQAGQAATTLSAAMQGYATNARQAAEAQRLLNFRGLAQQADESIAAARRLATATGQITASAGTFASSLRAIADPAGEARRTLAGLESQVDQLATEIAQINGPVRNYSETLLQLTAAQRAAANSAELIDRFRQQADSLRQARAQFVAARDAVRDYQRQIAAADAPSQDLVRGLRQAEQALAASARQYRNIAQATRDTRDELRAAGADTTRLTETQRRLEESTQRATQAVQRLNNAFTEFGSAGRGGVGVFGLTPFQVQNLGFQINDFFTQLSSGTSVTQAFAQQIGQVVQVFGPGSFAAVARWIPLLATFAITVGSVAAALGRLNSTAQSTRNFQARLDITGGLTSLSAEQLTAITREVEKLGVSFQDARQALLTFLNAGVISSGLRDITEIAVRYARITGQDIPAATQLFVRGLTEGRDGFNALLAAQVNFSDSTQRTITDLLSQGRVGQAQRVIIDALRDAYRAADQQGLSPFRQAAIEVRNAWASVLDELGRTGLVQALERALRSLAERGQQLAQVFRNLRGEAAAAEGAAPPEVVARQRRQTAEERLATAERRVAEGSSIFRFGSADQVAEAQRALPGLRAEVERLRREEEALNRAQQNGLRIQAEREGGGQAEQVRAQALRAQRDAAERLVAEREREALIADRTANADARREAVRQQARARVLERSPGLGDDEQGRRLIERAIATDLREFEERLKQERESAGRGAAAEVRRDFQAIQQDLQNTVRIRDETIRGIQEDVASGAITPTEAIQRIQAAADQARPALQALAEEARRFRDQNQGGDAVRRAALDSLVAQADRQAGAGGTRAGVTAVLQAQQQDVARLVQERQQFVQTQNALQQQGVVSFAESEERITAFYATTNDELARQINLLREAAQAARANGSISEAAFAQINGQLDLYTANLQRVNPLQAQLRNTIEQGFAQSFTTAFNTVAESLGGLLANTKSLSEAFDDAGRAALQFFADFLRSIGQAILQQQTLIVAKQISAALSALIFHSGGVVGAGRGSARAVNPAWFANAPRYHSGGLPGLRSDEVPAILQRGEEVLAKNDPRNILNGGGRTAAAASAPSSIRNVLAIGDDEIANAMNTTPGEQTILNVLRRNAPTVKQMLR